MQLIIESYCLTSAKLINEYLDIMEEINAKEIYKEKTDDYFEKENKYLHKIEFNKDLKVSELIQIKDSLYPEEIMAVWIKDDENKEITLFNKEWMI